MKVLQDHDVYEVIPGRVVDAQDRAVPDVISAGLSQLSHGNSTNPIAEFNEQFDRLRERRKLTPISDDLDFDLPDSRHTEHALPTTRLANSTESSLNRENGNEERPNSPTNELSGSEDNDLSKIKRLIPNWKPC
ncbi:hypothetical protein BDZ97DRAFT_1922415 [Flammula alnicola]|nr:hypothetical protein BDZ97DRAFT_1922415 [Flammula alnicola]